MRRLLVLFFALTASLVPLALAVTGGAPVCEGFPWTVTATPIGGNGVAVQICGTYAGCHPHNPQLSVSGSEIHVTLTQAELPDCGCVAIVGPFQETVIVHPVAPGNYTVTVTVISCGERTPAGSGSFVFGAPTPIPALGPSAAFAFALMLVVVAFLRLR